MIGIILMLYFCYGWVFQVIEPLKESQGACLLAATAIEIIAEAIIGVWYSER